MGDIVTRLRRWTHAVDAAPASDLMDEAADEIERLRFTDAEREAVELCAKIVRNINMAWSLLGINSREDRETEATLRGLLERLG